MTGSGGEKEGIAGDRLRKLDAFQQAHRPVAFLYAVVKKYSDDRGGQLAALIAYYGLVSLFPLLLVLFTVAAYVVPLFPSVQHGLVDSVLAQFPVIGPQLRENVQPLEGNSVALVLGVLTLLWGALGLAQLMQFTMLEVWNIPGRKRPGFVSRLVRSLLLYLSFAIGVSVTTFISSLGQVLDWGRAGSLLAALPGGIATIALFLLVFRILTPSGAAGSATPARCGRGRDRLADPSDRRDQSGQQSAPPCQSGVRRLRVDHRARGIPVPGRGAGRLLR